MPSVFISYRRNDSAEFASRLNQTLVSKLGRRGVVYDLVSIPAGVDYRDFLSRSIRECDVFIAVIGPSWCKTAIDGEQRLGQGHDPVRVEVEVALQANKLVIPVLINGASMPVEKDIPTTVKTLAYKNAISFSPPAEFADCIRTLLVAIDDYRKPKRLIRLLSATLTCFILATIAISVTAGVLQRQLTFARSVTGVEENLRQLDSVVFSVKQSEDDVGIARAFADRNSLDKAGSLIEQFQHARSSIDMFVFSGKSVADAEATIIESVERGTKIRIVLVDHTEANDVNIANYIALLNISGRKPEWYRANYASTLGILRRIDEMSRVSESRKGTFEVRSFVGPFPSSFWIRDANIPDCQVGHIAVTLFGDDRRFPSIRFGTLSDKVTQNLSQQFEFVWLQSENVLGESD